MSLPGNPTRSSEGFCYNVENDNLVTGLQTDAVKVSSSAFRSYYDAIVIGAGFTGLVAARDLSAAGKRVLLLEARDRIGGRTWTADVGDHKYEMGGTWIHWLQPHVWAEITRYGLATGLKVSTGMSGEGEVSYAREGAAGFVKERPELSDQRLLPLMAQFLDVDGCGGRTLFPEPWLPLKSVDVWRRWDISLQERVEQINISKQDRDFLLPWLCINTCAAASESSFLNLVRLYALSGYDYNLFMEICGKFKLKNGTTGLASAIYSEFKGQSIFSCPVKAVKSTTSGVEITTRAGDVFRAEQVVCTIPLHCLSDIAFSPPLPECFIKARHANIGGKFHILSSTPIAPWFGVNDEHHSVCAAFTESPASGGGTHLVSFAVGDKLIAQQDVRHDPMTYLRAVQRDVVPDSVHIRPVQLTWHDWARDEFSRGTWASYGPRQLSKGLGELMMQTYHGHRVVMASADWADGWVGYIDGALEMGKKAAVTVNSRLDSLTPQSHI
ncbi:hypothetical protein PFICI_03118 [Pestalotiopsis fici W106-1]|uniref:Amine oxidase n=1 Tax=Pestalotiopsis fici (strain W106-1 / CGMCC3.15140) TaxID=1229662 RepID=W3XG70_PESFW|nr:uncharacterized protein PFICI_03118 [Pestalotiopsis fici W106-1]ETS85093.1 hypothetical protein PFICI_03118 [Pestalotiopsis fici W106-1]